MRLHACVLVGPWPASLALTADKSGAHDHVPDSEETEAVDVPAKLLASSRQPVGGLPPHEPANLPRKARCSAKRQAAMTRCSRLCHVFAEVQLKDARSWIEAGGKSR